MNLLAETGGKNATIATALSDREQAIKHVLHSAFSHGGQKCSATSLLLLEAEVYDDPNFKRTLCDAVRSLPVGSAWELATRVGPQVLGGAGDVDRARGNQRQQHVLIHRQGIFPVVVLLVVRAKPVREGPVQVQFQGHAPCLAQRRPQGRRGHDHREQRDPYGHPRETEPRQRAVLRRQDDVFAVRRAPGLWRALCAKG